VRDEGKGKVNNTLPRGRHVACPVQACPPELSPAPQGQVKKICQKNFLKKIYPPKIFLKISYPKNISQKNFENFFFKF